MKVGYQGVEGAFSHVAVKEIFDGCESKGYDSFDQIFEDIKSGKLDRGVIPVENTIGGTITENFDLLLENEVYVIEEHYMKIRHFLLAKKGTMISDIIKVRSHPQALAQCRKYIQKKKFHQEAYYDTAGAAKSVVDGYENDVAAIGSKMCAEIYDLEIIDENIQTNGFNETRFFVISKKDEAKYKQKTSIAFKTKHYSGALVDCLKIFQEHKLNMTKLESRPLPDNPWEYVFFVDFEGGTDSQDVIESLDELKKFATFVKVLGSYPIAR